jgi:hypothetical protein
VLSDARHVLIIPSNVPVAHLDMAMDQINVLNVSPASVVLVHRISVPLALLVAMNVAHIIQLTVLHAHQVMATIQLLIHALNAQLILAA